LSQHRLDEADVGTVVEHVRRASILDEYELGLILFAGRHSRGAP
jgi:hypothetical protein